MIYLRPGSHAILLIRLLAITGEFPYSSLHLLGNKRTWQRLVLKLTETQDFKMPDCNCAYGIRLLQLRGAGKLRTIRFHKSGLSVLKLIAADLYSYYMDTFYSHQLPGDTYHIERNHRVAEALLMCMNAGLEIDPVVLPKLQKDSISIVLPNSAVFYQGKAIKKTRDAELNKTMFSRVAGLISYPGACHAVYNSRASIMKWGGMGEYKTKHSLIEVLRLNGGASDLNSAILFGKSYKLALRTMIECEKNRRLEFRFDGIYQHIYFVPMNSFGVRLLKLLTIPNWNEKLLGLLFEPEDRSYNTGFFEYDAYIDGKYIYSFLDSDIARLIRFCQALSGVDESCEVLCFAEQAELLRAYLPQTVELKLISMEDLEKNLGQQTLLDI